MGRRREGRSNLFSREAGKVFAALSDASNEQPEEIAGISRDQNQAALAIKRKVALDSEPR